MKGLIVGDHIKDNDVRMPGRVLVITGFCGQQCGDVFAVASVRGNGTGETEINVKRIHTDDKPRKSGWSLVPAP